MLEKMLRLAEWHERLRDQAGPGGPSYRMHRQSAIVIRTLAEECAAYRVKKLARAKGSDESYQRAVERHRKAVEAVDKLADSLEV